MGSDYHLSGATEELSCAADAARSKAAKVHVDLAERYGSVADDRLQLIPSANCMGWAQ